MRFSLLCGGVGNFRGRHALAEFGRFLRRILIAIGGGEIKPHQRERVVFGLFRQLGREFCRAVRTAHEIAGLNAAQLILRIGIVLCRRLAKPMRCGLIV